MKVIFNNKNGGIKMSYEEHYFENLLYHDHDINEYSNKNQLSKETQEAIETCAEYVRLNYFDIYRNLAKKEWS